MKKLRAVPGLRYILIASAMMVAAATLGPGCDNPLMARVRELVVSEQNPGPSGEDNHAPVAQSQNLETPPGVDLEITLSATDLDGDTLLWYYGQPSHGTLSGMAPTLVYAPASGYSGSDSFTYTASDGALSSGTATVAILVAVPKTWTEADTMGGPLGTASLGVVAIGMGRTTDSLIRVYVGENEFGGGIIHELSYSGTAWTKAPINDAADISHIAGIAVADVRGDGTRAVYASGNGFAEYLCSGSPTPAWNAPGYLDIAVYNGIQWNNGFVVGDGRGDGVKRVYVADGQDRVVEISYNLGDWNTKVIDTGSNSSVAVGQGRNDGKGRLYVIAGIFEGTIYEYSWNDTTEAWDIADCSALATPSVFFEAIWTGQGRNDGMTRIYAWGSSGLYELSYGSGTWSAIRITQASYDAPYVYGSSFYSGALAIADGRNDGRLRLYAADADGVGEYSFVGTSWEKTAQLTERNACGVAVGNGRNDNPPVNRVYVSANAVADTALTRVYEYTATSP